MSLLNGPSSRHAEAEKSSKIVRDKTSLSLSSYYLAKYFSKVFWILLLSTLCHHATDAVAPIFLLHWSLLLLPFFKRRTPNQLASLPTNHSRQPHRQDSLPFSYPATYFLISSYMLQMSFVSLLLGLARLGGLVLVANPMMARQAPGIPPEPEPDPHDFLPGRT